jgi:Tol biopolymer transport system component
LKKPISFLCILVLPTILMSLFWSEAGAAERLSADKAGEIGEPKGRIAFLRGQNVWVMDVRGQNQMLVCEATNAEGRLSWAPDNRRIAFTRAGRVNYQSPAVGEGGMHKVYDLFLAFLDSAEVGRTNWWNRLTENLGSRNPEWNADGMVIFTREMNANTVNATYPNYQICLVNPDGGEEEILRKDWQMMGEFFMQPSINKYGEIAFAHFYEHKPQGIAVLPRDHFMTPVDSVRLMSEKMKEAVTPAWSPDGQWLAYVNNNINTPGLYMTTRDLKTQYVVFEPPPGTYVTTIAPSFSPDSKWLTFSTSDGSIWICDITGNQRRRLSGPGLDTAPAWSK